MTREQKFKKSYAKELVRIAAGDFATLEVLATAGKGRPENVSALQLAKSTLDWAKGLCP